MNIKTFLTLAALMAVSGLLAGCSTNPATGRTQFAALMSPQQEKQVGAEEHPNIIAQYGEYDNARVQSYVRQIGMRVTRNTERPNVDYKFYVLDTPMVNAFALPGGYIYISRGLLAIADNEAELAAVLGHEAGHITGRHSAERYSRSVVTQLGAGLLAAAVDSAGVSQALGLGSDLYLKSYSRSQENEADTLGIRYLSRNGYDSSAMTTFLENLQRASAFEAMENGSSSSAAGVSYFSTHPATSDRVAKTASETLGGQNNGETNRNAYLDVIDGITYGDSAKQGFVRGSDFIHPSIGFKFSVPDGFKIINQPAQVIATSRDKSVLLFDFAANKAGQTPMAYLQNVWMKGEGVKNAEAITINGMPAATAAFAGTINKVPMTIRLIAIRFSAQSFARFQIAIPNTATGSMVDALKRSSYSFVKLSPDQKAGYKPYHLKIVTAKPGDNVTSMAASFPYKSLNEERFRMLNGMEPQENVTAGERYKVIMAP